MKFELKTAQIPLHVPRIKTMEVVMKQDKGNRGNPLIDLEDICLRLFMIGQRRQMELRPLFNYDLCAVPPSLVDEYSCLRWLSSQTQQVGAWVLSISHQQLPMLSLCVCSRCSSISCGHITHTVVVHMILSDPTNVV